MSKERCTCVEDHGLEGISPSAAPTMLVSELIFQLTQLLEKEGDLEVLIPGGDKWGHLKSPDEVRPYPITCECGYVERNILID